MRTAASLKQKPRLESHVSMCHVPAFAVKWSQDYQVHHGKAITTRSIKKNKAVKLESNSSFITAQTAAKPNVIITSVEYNLQKH